jgi:hypothetical protein
MLPALTTGERAPDSADLLRARGSKSPGEAIGLDLSQKFVAALAPEIKLVQLVHGDLSFRVVSGSEQEASDPLFDFCLGAGCVPEGAAVYLSQRHAVRDVRGLLPGW